MSGPDMPHEEWEELAAGYALHVLEPADELAFVQHMSSCARCTALVDENAEVAAALASVVADDDLPAPAWRDMRTAILGADQPAAVTPFVSAPSRRVRMPTRRLLAVAASVVVIVGAAVGALLASRGPHNPQPAGTLAACRQAPACSVVPLHSADGIRQAAVLVENGHATVVTLAMRTAPVGRTWALWQLPHGGKPTLLMEFRGSVPGNGRAAGTARLALSSADTAGFAVSLEPTGTVPTTPTQVVASGPRT